MKTSIAIGALALVAVAGSSHAAVTVTWDNSRAFHEVASFPDDYAFSLGGTNGAFGTGSFGAFGTGFSYTNSAAGFSMSNGVSVNGWLATGRTFTISGLGVGEGLAVSSMTNVSGVPSQINFELGYPNDFWGAAFFLDNSLAFAAGPGPLTVSGLLGNGTYRVSLLVGDVDEPGSTYTAAATFASFTIPTPGAAAVLGPRRPPRRASPPLSSLGSDRTT